MDVDFCFYGFCAPGLINQIRKDRSISIFQKEITVLLRFMMEYLVFLVERLWVMG